MAVFDAFLDVFLEAAEVVGTELHPLAIKANTVAAKRTPMKGIVVNAYILIVVGLRSLTVLPVRGGFGLYVFTCYFVGVANLCNQVPDHLNVHGLSPFLFLFPKQFSNTVLDVVCDFLAALLTGKIALHTVEIVLKKGVCVFVNGVKRTKKVDGYVLFHIMGCFTDSFSFFYLISASHAGRPVFRMATVRESWFQLASNWRKASSPSSVRA